MNDVKFIIAARELALDIADRVSRSPLVVTESVMLNRLADRVEAQVKRRKR